MPYREIKKNVFAVGAVDWDRRLFDELIPLPEGTSYNAYLLVGKEKTALIDTVDPTKSGELLVNLDRLSVKRIDYVVAHHAEQDHAGTIPEILARFPQAIVLSSAKGKPMLIDLLHLPAERIQEIQDGERLSLGGKTLEFISAPWVHWPETFLSYLHEDKILFPCDFLGSHLAQSELFVVDEARTLQAAKRYYAEIMMPFRTQIASHLQKLEKFAIEIIAPSHGTVYQNPQLIFSAYREWVSDRVVNKVLIPFVSMHGSTRRMVDHLTEQLMLRDIPVVPANIIRTDIGELAKELVDAATVVIASPMVLAGAHPEIVRAVYLANALRPKFRFAAIIGSFGWGGRMIENLQSMLTSVKPEILGTVFIQGLPREADYRALDRLADTIRQKHQSIGIA